MLDMSLRNGYQEEVKEDNITWEKYNKILQYNPIATPKIYYSLWQFE